jgi:hypothetical protein
MSFAPGNELLSRDPLKKTFSGVVLVNWVSYVMKRLKKKIMQDLWGSN